MGEGSRTLGSACVSWLLLAACLGAAGCDALFEVRVDIRSGEEQTVEIVRASELDGLEAPPLEGVLVQLRPAWNHRATRALKSGPDGVVKTDFTLGGPPWAGSELGELEVSFSASKPGTSSIDGTFALRGFRGTASHHGQTVLVIMPSESQSPR